MPALRERSGNEPDHLTGDRYFVQDFVGGELMELDKQTWGRWARIIEGYVIEQEDYAGVVRLFTKVEATTLFPPIDFRWLLKRGGKACESYLPCEHPMNMAIFVPQADEPTLIQNASQLAESHALVTPASNTLHDADVIYGNSDSISMDVDMDGDFNAVNNDSDSEEEVLVHDDALDEWYRMQVSIACDPSTELKGKVHCSSSPQQMSDSPAQLSSPIATPSTFSSSVSTAPTPDATPYATQRQNAIQFICDVFPQSPTHNCFNGPVVAVDQVHPLAPSAGFSHGRKLIVPASTELRMCLWYLQNPSLSRDDLLFLALTKGLLLHTFSSTNKSVISSPCPLINIKSYLIQQNRSEKVSARMVTEYYKNAQVLLNHPNSRRFFACGGLVWRLARYHAPWVYATTLVSPPHVPSSSSGLGVTTVNSFDPISPNEIKMLIGLTTNNNTFWPYPDIFENSSRYIGEWTDANEAWFKAHTNTIESCWEGCLCNRSKWRCGEHVYSAAQLDNPDIPGTNAHAKVLCTDLVHQYPQMWWDFDHSILQGQ